MQTHLQKPGADAISFAKFFSQNLFQEDYLYDKLDTLWSGGTLTTNSTSAILGVQLLANKTDDLLFPTEGYSLTILAEDGNALPYIFSKIGNYNFGQTAYYKLIKSPNSWSGILNIFLI